MKTIKKCLDFIERILQVVIAIMTLVMLTIAVVEVFRRYLFGRSFAWSQDLILLCLTWVTFLGAAVCLRQKSLVCFDLIISRLHGRTRMIIDIISNTMVIAFLSGILYYGVIACSSPSIVNKIVPGIQISSLYYYISIPIGTLACIIFALENYYKIYESSKFAIEEGTVKSEC